jgi:hypothetical protein
MAATVPTKRLRKVVSQGGPGWQDELNAFVHTGGNVRHNLPLSWHTHTHPHHSGSPHNHLILISDRGMCFALLGNCEQRDLKVHAVVYQYCRPAISHPHTAT